VPLAPEIVDLLKAVIGDRTGGPVSLRDSVARAAATASGSSTAAILNSEAALTRRAESLLIEQRKHSNGPPDRWEENRIYEQVWKEAGALKRDRARTSFLRAAVKAGLPVSCPKSWRRRRCSTAPTSPTPAAGSAAPPPPRSTPAGWSARSVAPTAS
jgi:hypothetical protein